MFETDNECAPRIVFESLCPGIKISSEAVDMFTKVLNHAEKYRDPKKRMCKVFCDTSLMVCIIYYIMRMVHTYMEIREHCFPLLISVDLSLIIKSSCKQREWDVTDLADKKLDVKESADKFIKGMLGILRTTVYGTLANVDLVIFVN